MDVIVKPIITEKYTALGEKLNRYGFIVNMDANKVQIKSAVEKAYGVNTQRYIGKTKTRYTKAGFISGVVNRQKKAIITLADGETIDFYSNI
jgi:large subunit ribosomal protein L23